MFVRPLLPSLPAPYKFPVFPVLVLSYRRGTVPQTLDWLLAKTARIYV